MSELKMGYWFVARELAWSAYKALLIVTILSALRFGFLLNDSKLSNDAIDAFGGALLMHSLGFVLFVPFIMLFVFIIGAPISKMLINKYDNNVYFLALGGVFVSLFVFKSLALLNSDEGVSINLLLTGNFDLILGGFLTGLFLSKQLDKNALRQEPTKTDSDE